MRFFLFLKFTAGSEKRGKISVMITPNYSTTKHMSQRLSIVFDVVYFYQITVCMVKYEVQRKSFQALFGQHYPSYHEKGKRSTELQMTDNSCRYQ